MLRFRKGVSPSGQRPCYFLEAAARFDALRGLIFWFSSEALRWMWVAKLQAPRAHLALGSGATAQSSPSGEATVREQPWHCSTTVWQRPPLKLHPFFVMKAHSTPCFKVIHCIFFPPRGGKFGTLWVFCTINYQYVHSWRTCLEKSVAPGKKHCASSPGTTRPRCGL